MNSAVTGCCSGRVMQTSEAFPILILRHSDFSIFVAINRSLTYEALPLGPRSVY